MKRWNLEFFFAFQIELPVNSTNRASIAKDGNKDAGIQVPRFFSIDLTDDFEDEPLIPVLQLSGAVIDLTKPIRISSAVDLTLDSMDVHIPCTPPESFSPAHMDSSFVVDLTMDSMDVHISSASPESFFPAHMDSTEQFLNSNTTETDYILDSSSASETHPIDRSGIIENDEIDLTEGHPIQSLQELALLNIRENESIVAESIDLTSLEQIEKEPDILAVDDDSNTANERQHNADVKHLTEQLQLLQNKILVLERAEVDLDDEDDSNFLLMDRYKAQACQIYEDITGKSIKYAAAPIQFNGTSFTEFNRRFEEMINRKKKFPNSSDVLKCAKFCNERYNYQLTEDDCFEIGKLFYFNSALFQHFNAFHCKEKLAVKFYETLKTSTHFA